MKILIIRLSSLGDIVLTQPICTILSKHFPGCELSYVCKPEYHELVQLFDTPVRVMDYYKSLGFYARLRRENYDLVIDLHGKLASWLISFAAKAKRKVCYNKQRGLRQKIVHGDKQATIESTVSLYASALRKLDITESWEYPVFRTPIKPEGERNSEKKRIAIFPGATHFTKCYPGESWIKVINSMPQHYFTLFGGKADLALNKAINSQTKGNCSDQTAKHGFAELLQELSSHSLILSGDTGPMHLAATLGKPQIAIFGGTHPRLGFNPLNPQARIICLDLPCQPCSLHGRKQCPLGHFKCMNDISSDYIVKQIDMALQLNNNLK